MPDAIMAAPLLEDGRVLGVLSVLDRRATERSPQQELELLVAAVRLRGRRARAGRAGAGGRAAAALMRQGIRSAGAAAGRSPATGPAASVQRLTFTRLPRAAIASM